MSSRARIGIVVGAVVVLVVAFIIASGGGDDDNNDKTAASTTQQAVTPPAAETTTDSTGGATTSTATTPTASAEQAVRVVVVKDGKPAGGIQKLKFTKGDTIAFKVVSDQPGEIHFHGYDIPQEVKTAGGSTTFKVKATIEGRFVVEMESTGQQIAEVEVDPS